MEEGTFELKMYHKSVELNPKMKTGKSTGGASPKTFE
jgi:hypothetical protein